MASPIRLSVVIPTWNAAELTSTSLASVLRDGLPEWAEVIVVDDGSDDATAKLIRDRYPSVTVLRHEQNRGFGAAVNTGFRAARGHFLATINNDALVSWTVLDRVATFLEHEPRAAAASPQIVDADGRPQRVGFDLPRPPWRRLGRRWPVAEPATGRDGRPDRPRPAEYLKGACVVFVRPALQQVGLFDEQFHMFAEEIDLFHRLSDAHWTAWVVPDVQVTHAAGATSRNHSDTRLARRFRLQSYRSLCIYYRKHFSGLGASSLQAILAVRLLGRLARALVDSGRGWGDPRGGREILACLAVVIRTCRSTPDEPGLS